MRRTWALAVGLVVVLLVALELAIPRFLEQRAESRLTAGGGTAEVTLDALPAERLLFGDGRRVAVEGRGLKLGLSGGGANVLEGLDGFDEVDVRLSDMEVGPFRASELTLIRPGGSPEYRLKVSAATSAGQVARLAGARLGGLVSGLAGRIAGGAEVALQVDVRFESDGGRIRVVSASGDLDGPGLVRLTEAFARAVGAPLD